MIHNNIAERKISLTNSLEIYITSNDEPEMPSPSSWSVRNMEFQVPSKSTESESEF